MRSTRLRCAAAAVLAVVACASARDAAATPDEAARLPAGVVARVYGKDITEDALLDRIARTYERTERGREALNELVDDICVRREAERRGVVVSEEELATYIERWDETVRRQSGGKASLSDLYEESDERDEFLAAAREFLVRQKMAREDLGSRPDEDLSEHYLKLWLSSVRRRAGVRYDDLAAGVVAEVAEHRVTCEDLARRIRSKLPDEIVSAIGNELVIAAASERDARAAGIELTEADLDDAMQELRERFAAEPQVQGSGVDFDQFLRKMRGYGESELRADPVFRARIALRRMLESRVDDADDVRAHWEAHRVAYGERAVVRQMFFQAGEGGGEFALPSFKQARDDALGARVEIFEAAGLHLPEAERPKLPLGVLLARVAKRHARDDEGRRAAGEQVAWTRLSVEGEPKLAQAVFEGAVGTLQGPIQSAIGYHLLVVEERREAPPFDAIRDRVREDLVQARINEYQIRCKADSENVIRAW